MKILILGGGVGGLAAAIALRRVGLEDVAVYEQAAEFTEVGAGLGVLSNAVRALEALGIDGPVRKHGFPLQVGQICNAQGRVLVSLEFSSLLDPRYPSYVAHRADLLGWLLDALPRDILHPGHKAVMVDISSPDRVALHFENGARAEGDVLIGADGIRSMVRTALWGEHPMRYAGQVCYRGIANYKLKEPHIMREINGAGMRAAPIAISPERVYWWAALNGKPNMGDQDDPATRRERLLETYHNWPFEVPEVIAATPTEAILRNDLYDISPLKTWTQGRITLLGDAAHPMQPNLGQGACSSLEDAVVLARHMAPWAKRKTRKRERVEEVLRLYEAERLPRTTRLVKESWNFGTTSLWSSPLAVALRDMLMSLMPPSIVARGFDRNMNFDVGKLPMA
ncbi:hypothetical protein DB346_18955 [Verrucomicrobia bacterium LW23]|nr:hypothetical protein DB346_18955 [Verrucomicrobia bacterium LW23]